MGTPIRGFGGVIELGGTPETLGEVRSWSYTREGEEEDTSVMGTTRTSITNIKVSGSLTLYANHFVMTDPARDAGQALLAVDSVVACSLFPNGKGTGKPELQANIRITSEEVTAEHDGFVELDVDYEVDGADDWTRTAQA